MALTTWRKVQKTSKAVADKSTRSVFLDGLCPMRQKQEDAEEGEALNARYTYPPKAGQRLLGVCTVYGFDGGLAAYGVMKPHLAVQRQAGSPSYHFEFISLFYIRWLEQSGNGRWHIAFGLSRSAGTGTAGAIRAGIRLNAYSYARIFLRPAGIVKALGLPEEGHVPLFQDFLFSRASSAPAHRVFHSAGGKILLRKGRTIAERNRIRGSRRPP